MLRFVTKLAFVVIGCVMLAGPCLAHATLVGSEPTEGSITVTPPGKMRLSFNEPVTLLALKLFTPDGRDAEITATTEGSDLVVELPAAGDGTYALSWRVASADGHPIGGTSTFSVGHASQRSAATDPSRSSAVACLIWLARVGVYIGWIGGVGGAFFLTVIARQRPPLADRATLVLIGVGAAASVFSFGLQGLDELGGGLAGLASAAAWVAGLQSRYGGTLGLGGAALVVAVSALYSPKRLMAAGLATAALLMIAVALTLSGHTGTATPAFVARPALALHGAAAALWGGSLLPLLILVVTRQDNAGRVALRLSALLLPTVAVLALSGITLAFVQGVGTASLIGTDYGRLLAGKLLLVLVMLGLGALNRRILVPRAARGSSLQLRNLGRVLAVDVCLLLLVLAVVAGWRFTPPPRSVAAAEAALRHRQMVHIHTDRGMAMIQLVDQGGLDIRLSSAQGRPLVAQDVQVSVANPAAGLEPLGRPAMRVADGHWRVDGLTFPVGGAWTLQIEVLISDFDSLSLEGTLTVP